MICITCFSVVYVMNQLRIDLSLADGVQLEIHVGTILNFMQMGDHYNYIYELHVVNKSRHTIEIPDHDTSYS